MAGPAHGVRSLCCVGITGGSPYQEPSTSPFLEGGFGLYLASFDPQRATDIPSFYADRLTGNITQRFTDPAFFAAFGMDLLHYRRLTIGPDVGAIVAVRHSQTYLVGTFTVRAQFHFGDYPPTQAR